MKKYSSLALAVLVSASLVGCNGSNINNQDVGTLAGGALGGLLGSQFGGGAGKIVAAVGGTLLGGYLGNRIGASMDRTDQVMMQQSLNNGQTQSWTNGNTGNQYKIVPGQATSPTCRAYTMYATIDGKKKPIQGTACNQNGQWVAQG